MKIELKYASKLHLIYELSESTTLKVANESEYETTLTLQNEFKIYNQNYSTKSNSRHASKSHLIYESRR